MNFTPGDIVTIVLSVLGLIGVLLGLIYRLHSNSVSKLETQIDNVQTKLDEEIRIRNDQHNSSFTRVYGRIETVEKDQHRVEVDLTKQLGDLEITVAGFGSTYATRREVENREGRK